MNETMYLPSMLELINKRNRYLYALETIQILLKEPATVDRDIRISSLVNLVLDEYKG